jgi:hypothetical protein
MRRIPAQVVVLNMLRPFGNEGHFLIDSADAIPLWAPLVSKFLDKHQ